ncbi:hypothetical protein ACQU0X_23950 [Pseudovibrio ascidiaceicola]|uniref:hypothetical protein n=1 Tax=Pseudovibrio ascidiaceicola TaxID=285279 RepID=UPI003D36C596
MPNATFQPTDKLFTAHGIEVEIIEKLPKRGYLVRSVSLVATIETRDDYDEDSITHEEHLIFFVEAVYRFRDLPVVTSMAKARKRVMASGKQLHQLEKEERDIKYQISALKREKEQLLEESGDAWQLAAFTRLRKEKKGLFLKFWRPGFSHGHRFETIENSFPHCLTRHKAKVIVAERLTTEYGEQTFFQVAYKDYSDNDHAKYFPCRDEEHLKQIKAEVASWWITAQSANQYAGLKALRECLEWGKKHGASSAALETVEKRIRTKEHELERKKADEARVLREKLQKLEGTK